MDFFQQGMYVGVNVEGFVWNDLVVGQQCFGVVVEIDDDVVVGDFFYGIRNDFVDFFVVGIDYLGVFGFVDFLYDDLFGSLCSDVVEFDGFDFFFDDFVDFCVWFLFLDVFDGDFGGGVLVVFVGDDVLMMESFVVVVMMIDFDVQVDFVFEMFFGGGCQSQFQCFENYVGWYVFFVGY